MSAAESWQQTRRMPAALDIIDSGKRIGPLAGRLPLKRSGGSRVDIGASLALSARTYPVPLENSPTPTYANPSRRYSSPLLPFRHTLSPHPHKSPNNFLDTPQSICDTFHQIVYTCFKKPPAIPFRPLLSLRLRVEKSDVAHHRRQIATDHPTTTRKTTSQPPLTTQPFHKTLLNQLLKLPKNAQGGY